MAVVAATAAGRRVVGSWSGESGELDAELLDDAISGSEVASTKYSLAVESSRIKAEREGEVPLVWGSVRRVGRTRLGQVVSGASGGGVGVGGVGRGHGAGVGVAATVGRAEENDTQRPTQAARRNKNQQT